MIEMRGAARAPEFPSDLSWLNVEKPLSLKELRGKIVLLDFWTYCCINCIHVIPELKKLEDRFPDTLVVIGVHSPKYYAEAVLENVRQAVLRHDVRHPVVSDPRHEVWDSYAISAWPTTALVSPDGYLLGEHPGEFDVEEYAPVIRRVEDEYGRRGMLDRTPLRLNLEQANEPDRLLSYPGKVLADAGANRLFIADSSHHRIILTDLIGQVMAVAGSGERGMDDGPFDSASFNSPQGMAVSGDILYVADTENHAVRRLDFRDRRVERIAGTGEPARLSRRGGPALSSNLSSPWDLALDGNALYIAMAGNHQIWRLDLEAREAVRFIGTGREALSDGTLERCALAQTSGLSFREGRLYFADSETSSIRVADIGADRVETLVGQGLFVFGDRDGIGDEVRLQHCLGVDCYEGLLYVADTYNNKIKVINPTRRSCRTLFGVGEAGLQDGAGDFARFWEPGGVCVSADKAYIADTNNHAIRVADLETGEVSTLEITGT